MLVLWVLLVMACKSLKIFPSRLWKKPVKCRKSNASISIYLLWTERIVSYSRNHSKCRIRMSFLIAYGLTLSLAKSRCLRESFKLPEIHVRKAVASLRRQKGIAGSPMLGIVFHSSSITRLWVRNLLMRTKPMRKGKVLWPSTCQWTRTL